MEMRNYYLFENALGIVSNGMVCKVKLTGDLLEAFNQGDTWTLDRLNPLVWQLLDMIPDSWFQGAIAVRQAEKLDIFVGAGR